MFGLFESVAKIATGVALTPVAVVSDVVDAVIDEGSRPPATTEALKVVATGVKDALTPSKW